MEGYTSLLENLSLEIFTLYYLKMSPHIYIHQYLSFMFKLFNKELIYNFIISKLPSPILNFKL